jgi:hypothetical protein
MSASSARSSATAEILASKGRAWQHLVGIKRVGRIYDGASKVSGTSVLRLFGVLAVKEMTSLPGMLLARGVCRGLAQHGWVCLTEVTLANGRRADVMALAPDGDILIVEVKSSIEDFRGDKKWQEYREYCDAFYFAVPDNFPTELIPEDCGLIAADPFAAEILRPAPVLRLAPARRKALTLRFAQLAARRLHRLVDPAMVLSQ